MAKKKRAFVKKDNAVLKQAKNVPNAAKENWITTAY